MGMARYTLRRLLQAVPVLIGIATITFLLVNAIPGDPARILIGPGAPADAVDAIRAKYGLDRPLWERYLAYMFGVVQGDFGTSIHYGGAPVIDKIMERLPVTLLLMASSFVFAIVTAIPLGILSAKRRNEPSDHISRIVALFGVSTPSFWIGLMLIIVFSFHLDVLPATSLVLPWADPSTVEGATTRLDVLWQAFIHLLMPSITLGTLYMAAIMRIERSSMLEVLKKPYIDLARAYGVPERKITRRHAFRNAQLPVLTVVGLQLTSALGGAVLTETVFNINGMGRLVITAINNQDYQLVMGTTLFFGVTFVVGVIITDLAYAWVDPRVSYDAEAN
ncbi:ABC transporter permease [Halomarina oriensis]|uniref:ABC transporter permease subunit n=1 Tax=Halomarina oriensis TaxID=671145 RepID=A0A6B0GS27_9EURY|nr:ABC transporter permease [Halomarina oriensis]MWG36961.1 ABC transporter permease subunit [Halomarina oriensis]